MSSTSLGGTGPGLLEGRAAVVTGAGRGVGRAIAESLVAEGASVVVADNGASIGGEDGDPTVAQETAAALGKKAVAFADSVASPGAAKGLVELAVKTFGGIDIVVNNAGTLGGQSLVRDDLDDIRAVLETNFFGAIRVTQAFAPLLAGKGGTIVNIASVLSWLPGYGSYGVSKAALWSATNSVRQELKEQGTNVIGAYLGYTDTDMIADLDVPKNSPDDVARQIVDGIISGVPEVLADDLTRQVHAPMFPVA